MGKPMGFRLQQWERYIYETLEKADKGTEKIPRTEKDQNRWNHDREGYPGIHGLCHGVRGIRNDMEKKTKGNRKMKKEKTGKAIIGLNISLAVCFGALALHFFYEGQVLSGIFNLLSSVLQADMARINHSILFAKI